MRKLNKANTYSTFRKILCITLILSMTLGMLQPAMAMGKLNNGISGDVSDYPYTTDFYQIEGLENIIAIDGLFSEHYALCSNGTVFHWSSYGEDKDVFPQIIQVSLM